MTSPLPTDEDRPTASTSNYGWALWHLAKAEAAQTTEEAQVHATCAQARALLASVCEMGATRGVDPNGPTTWEGTWE